jgi:rhamnogalacturonan endolyase
MNRLNTGPLQFAGCLALLGHGLAFAAPQATALESATVATARGKQVERLDRGLIAVPAAGAAGGVFLSWRLLATDAADIAFNLYRGAKLLNAEPLTLSNYVDPQGRADSRYSVRAVVGGLEQAPKPSDFEVSSGSQPFKTIPLKKPADGVTPDGQRFSYAVNDGSVADLDGDGVYEFIIKWQPSNARDNSQKGHTGATLIDAYRLDGTLLWRIDLGPNIRAGAHYTSFLAYDFDGDGRAELMLKTADGSVDGLGAVMGDAKADHRNAAGYVLAGPEFLTVFNGMTGAAMASAGYLPARGDVAAWGDAYGNRVDRFLAGVAYLDGARPSAVFSRGYYTRAVLVAWDWRDGKLSRRWTFDSDIAGQEVKGQGAHWFSVADVDGDTRDDIVFGAATIGSDGKLIYSTGLGHGDALHVSQFDPARPGQQIFMVHESPRSYGEHGLEMHDAASGKILWSMSGEGTDVGRGICMDIDPAYPGAECWGSVGGLMSAGGKLISEQHPRRFNFALWWDGDLLRESLDGVTIDKWNPAQFAFERLLNGADFGAASINGTKANPVLSGDLFGDWREEVVWRNADNTALLIFSTNLPTPHRLTSLMHDPQYRVQVAAQNAAYNQPPHPSFHLGVGMSLPKQVPVYAP